MAPKEPWGDSGSEMPPLTIRIKKGRDRTAALSCGRADGTVTWQRQEAGQAEFFPRHDLTHYAVETILGHRRGFYGLLAEGWEFSDFGTPWPRGPIPADADPSELIVGFLDAERASGVDWSAADLMEQAAQYYSAHGLVAPPPVITDNQLACIRARMRELFADWDAIPPGEALELVFDPAAPGG
jgi:hypothetical protein